MKKYLLSLLALVAMVVPMNAQTELWNSNFTLESWFGDANWGTETESTATLDNGVVTVKIAQNKDAQWKAQVKLGTGLTQLDANKQYDFTCKAKANTAVGGVTFKMMDNVEMKYENQSLKLVEGENTITEKNIDGKIDVSNGVIVFDFGYATAGTEITLSDFSLVEHDPVAADAVTPWDATASNNLWAANLTPESYWYAPGWAQIADPTMTVNGDRSFTLSFPSATTDQWQAQVHMPSGIKTTADVNYDFQVVLNSTTDIAGATIKFVKVGDDNSFYTADRHKLKAGEDFVFQLEDVNGIDMDELKLVLDFGGNPANTVVTIKDIVVRQHPTAWHACGDFNNWTTENTDVTFCSTPNPLVFKASVAKFNTGTWGFKIINGTSWDCTQIGAASEDVLAVANGDACPLTSDGGQNIYINKKNANLTLTNVVFTLTFNADGTPATLAVACDPVEEAADTYYMPGTCKGWNFDDTTKFTYEGNGVYTLSYDSFYGDFKVVKNGAWGSENEYGGAGNNMMPGNEYTLTKGGNNTGFATGIVVKNCKFTLTVKEDGTHTLKVEGTAGEEHSYGLVGNFQGWSASNAPLFTEQADGSWTIDEADFPGGEGFKVSIDKSWTCFCPTGSDYQMTFGQPVTCERADGKNYTIGESGKKYNVHMVLVVAADAQSATLTVTDVTTGINLLNTTVDAQQIFNLAGQRLAQPQKGINIINGKKVIIK